MIGIGSYVAVGNNIVADAYDVDAQAFFTSASITDATQKNAVNQLVLDLKEYSLWTKFYALYPFVGGDATKHSFNLKDPASYQITWSGGVTHDANGVTGNGSTGTGDTGLNDNTVTLQNDVAIATYNRTDSTGVKVEIGVNGNLNIMQIKRDSTPLSRFFSRGDTLSVTNITNSSGLFIGSRTASNASAIYQNGVSKGTSAGASSAKNNANYFLLNYTSASAQNSNRNIALASISTGMDATQAANYYTAVQAFQTSLSRNV